MSLRINIAKSELAEFCRSHDFKRLSLFGSHQKGTAGPKSDVDLLVEFEPGRTPGFLALSEMEAELSAKLGACQ